jgi:hypothetical protein
MSIIYREGGDVRQTDMSEVVITVKSGLMGDIKSPDLKIIYSTTAIANIKHSTDRDKESVTIVLYQNKI